MPLRGKAGSKFQAAKTPWAPPGLGALVSDAVVTEADGSDRTVGLQGIRQCLSGAAGDRNCKLRRPRGHPLALAPSSPMLLPWRSMSVTVQLDFKASASAFQKKRGIEIASCEDLAGTAWPWRPHPRSCCNGGRRG